MALGQTKPFEWDSSYSVGVTKLDDDHKRLIEIINRISEMEITRASLKGILGELDNYTREHFRREEAQMEAANYPYLEEHRVAHKIFIEWLGTTRKTFAMEPDAQHYLADLMLAYLENWWTNHILTIDMKYKSYLA